MLFLNYSNIIDPLLKEVRIFVPKFSGAKNGDRILDLCCGTGDQLFYFSKLGVDGVGIDINPGMIKIAKNKKNRLKENNVSFLVGDATKIPFEKNIFDFVLISLGLHEVDAKLRDMIVSEMLRVVKKDGFLIFVDFSSPLPKNLNSLFVKTVEYFVDKDRFKDYLKKGGLLGILQKNNLKPEKIHSLMSGLITAIKVKK